MGRMGMRDRSREKEGKRGGERQEAEMVYGIRSGRREDEGRKTAGGGLGVWKAVEQVPGPESAGKRGFGETCCSEV